MCQYKTGHAAAARGLPRPLIANVLNLSVRQFHTALLQSISNMTLKCLTN